MVRGCHSIFTAVLLGDKEAGVCYYMVLVVGVVVVDVPSSGSRHGYGGALRRVAVACCCCAAVGGYAHNRSCLGNILVCQIMYH